ncbi:MAG: VCBS repeat-containing protein [Candidatus Krumholzibacteriia bacterium]
MRSTVVSTCAARPRSARSLLHAALLPAAVAAAVAAVLALALIPCRAGAQEEELTYDQYRGIARVADRLLHVVMFEPLEGQPGMYVAMGDRYNGLHVYYMTGTEGERVWRSPTLSGVVDELLVTDRDGDGLDDALIARTSQGRIYVWDLDGYRLLYESLPGEYQNITCFTVHDMDRDPAMEIVFNADRRIYYIDAVTFTREFASLSEYQATEMRAGDVDGDGRPDIVLNTGQVLDGSTGEVKWEGEVFGTRIELLDFDGDGILEVLTESDGAPLRVFEVDYRQELRFQ